MFGAISRFLDMFSYLRSPFLLMIRLVWGFLFIVAASDKLANWDARLDFFTNTLAMPMPYYSLVLVTFFEYVGGFCLMIGLFSRFWAFSLSIAMGVALCTAHSEAFVPLNNSFNTLVESGFFAVNSDLLSFSILVPSGTLGIAKLTSQGPFPYIYMTMLVLMWGPGCFSVDWLLCKMFGRKKAAEVPEESDLAD